MMLEDHFGCSMSKPQALREPLKTKEEGSDETLTMSVLMPTPGVYLKVLSRLC